MRIAFKNDGSSLLTVNRQFKLELRDPVTFDVRLSMGGRGTASLRPQFHPTQSLLKTDNGCGGVGARVNGGTASMGYRERCRDRRRTARLFARRGRLMARPS